MFEVTWQLTLGLAQPGASLPALQSRPCPQLLCARLWHQCALVTHLSVQE